LKKKLDNDHIPDKIKLRTQYLPKKDSVKVLECYAGNGVLWNMIKSKYPGIEVLRIEKENKKAVALRGDNMKWLPSIDIHQFDVIDLDSYGSPIQQLEHVLERGFKGIIHVTFINCGMGSLPQKLLSKLGITEKMRKKAPILCSSNQFQKMLDYLSILGFKEISHISHGKKHYIVLDSSKLRILAE